MADPDDQDNLTGPWSVWAMEFAQTENRLARG
jgi:hypothetical protein